LLKGIRRPPDSETARIEIQGAIVQVVDPAENNATIEYNTVLTAGIIEPASGSVPSYTGVGLNIMDAAAVAHFTPALVGAPSKIALVYVTFFGQTLGGQNLQSDQYQFPVDVCAGCLVTFPSGTTNVAVYCTGPSTDAIVQACVAGQDQSTDCTYCSGSSPYCAKPD
jgi:hypothetical protein